MLPHLPTEVDSELFFKFEQPHSDDCPVATTDVMIAVAELFAKLNFCLQKDAASSGRWGCTFPNMRRQAQHFNVCHSGNRFVIKLIVV